MFTHGYTKTTQYLTKGVLNSLHMFAYHNVAKRTLLLSSKDSKLPNRYKLWFLSWVSFKRLQLTQWNHARLHESYLNTLSVLMKKITWWIYQFSHVSWICAKSTMVIFLPWRSLKFRFSTGPNMVVLCPRTVNICPITANRTPMIDREELNPIKTIRHSLEERILNYGLKTCWQHVGGNRPPWSTLCMSECSFLIWGDFQRSILDDMPTMSSLINNITSYWRS